MTRRRSLLLVAVCGAANFVLRGTYHAHGAADDELRFVKVVDMCDDGARAADLETGIWERDP